MKKIIGGVFAFLMLVMPFANVLAETRAYSKGDVVNFKRFENDDTGVSAIVFADSYAGEQYARVMVAVASIGEEPFANQKDNLYDADNNQPIGIEDPKDYKNTLKYKVGLLNQMNSNGSLSGLVNIGKLGENNQVTVDYPSKDELVNVFGGDCSAGTTCSFDITKNTEAWKLLTDMLSNSQFPNKGVTTYTIDETSNKVWVLDMQIDAQKTLQSASMIMVDYDTQGYAALAVIDADKTWDCLYEGGAIYSCYNCSDTYKWAEVGTQDGTCELIPSIKTKSKCIKSPKTGVKEYAIEFIAILGIGLVILSVVKRKDLFRSI